MNELIGIEVTLYNLDEDETIKITFGGETSDTNETGNITMILHRMDARVLEKSLNGLRPWLNKHPTDQDDC